MSDNRDDYAWDRALDCSALPAAAPGSPSLQRRATMRDVARHAAVSVMTVSRVVNRTGNVDARTRARVETAISALGYRHNEAASALRRTGSHTSTIGLVVDDVANPFCSAVQRGVERACRRSGYLLFSGSSMGRTEDERSLVAAFLRRRVDGLIVMGADPHPAYLADEARRGVPSVFVDRRPADFEADHVVIDNRQAAHTGVAHLMRAGHRRIALLTAQDWIETSGRRREGYQDALAAAGIPLDCHLELTDLPDAASAAEALGTLLDGPNPPTAVFAAQNLLTIGAVAALHVRDLQHRIALVGFDDVELAERLAPPVTLVRQDPVRMGEEAALLLLRRIGGEGGPPVSRVLPAELVVRGSGEIPPLEGVDVVDVRDAAEAVPVIGR